MQPTFIEQVQSCKEKLEGIILDTPLGYAPILSKMCQSNIYLKKENLQKTGAFKIRGAFNKISNLSDADKQKGIITSSAGNHAQGVAFSGHYFQLPVTIVMPENTPLTKINGVKEYGAKVVLHGNNYDEAFTKAMSLQQENGYTFIHPFADDEIIVGQGTIGLEVLAKINDLDKIIIPVGGGGLIAGIAKYIKLKSPKTKVIGVSALGAPAMNQSFSSGILSATDTVRTIADGIAVAKANEMTYRYIKANVDEMIAVDDDEIASAILFLLERQKVLVEGAGAVGVAGLLSQKVPLSKGENVACILSGGNIDVSMLSVIMEKGLGKSYRTMKFVVTLIDKPGSLMTLTNILKAVQGNITHIEYDRKSTTLDYGDANVTVALETKGESHQIEIREALEKEGFEIRRIL